MPVVTMAMASLYVMGCTISTSLTSQRDDSSQTREDCPLDVNCALGDGASVGAFDVNGIARARRNTLQFQGIPSTSSGTFVWIAGRPMALATHHQFSFEIGSDGRGLYLPEQAFRFDYTTSSCNGGAPTALVTGKGARVIATSFDADFALLDLTTKLAAANPFIGRDGIPLQLNPQDQPSIGHPLYSIHHLNGLPQQWWAGTVLAVAESYGAVRFETNTWAGDSGGFASGAPVLNASGHLVGTHALGVGHDTCERISGDMSWQTSFHASIYPTICPLLTPNEGCTDTHELPYVLPRAPSAYNYVQLDSHANPNACWDAPEWVRTVQQEEHVTNQEQAHDLCAEAEEPIWLGRYRYAFDLYDASGFNLTYHAGLARSLATDVHLLLEYQNPQLRFTGVCWMQETFRGNTGISVYCDVPLKRGVNRATLTVTDKTGQQSVYTSFICAKGQPFMPSC